MAAIRADPRPPRTGSGPRTRPPSAAPPRCGAAPVAARRRAVPGAGAGPRPGRGPRARRRHPRRRAGSRRTAESPAGGPVRSAPSPHRDGRVGVGTPTTAAARTCRTVGPHAVTRLPSPEPLDRRQPWLGRARPRRRRSARPPLLIHRPRPTLPRRGGATYTRAAPVLPHVLVHAAPSRPARRATGPPAPRAGVGRSGALAPRPTPTPSPSDPPRRCWSPRRQLLGRAEPAQRVAPQHPPGARGGSAGTPGPRHRGRGRARPRPAPGGGRARVGGRAGPGPGDGGPVAGRLRHHGPPADGARSALTGFDAAGPRPYHLACGVEQWQLVGLITRRSRVRISAPQRSRPGRAPVGGHLGAAIARGPVPRPAPVRRYSSGVRALGS